MKLEIQTESGDVYILDRSEMSWVRISLDLDSVMVHSESGDLWDWPNMSIGKILLLFTSPIEKDSKIRAIKTSRVTRIMAV